MSYNNRPAAPSPQPRREIGAPNDPAEIEADRVAAQVTSTDAGSGKMRVSQRRRSYAASPPMAPLLEPKPKTASLRFRTI